MRFHNANTIRSLSALALNAFFICVCFITVPGQARTTTKLRYEELPNLGRVNEKLYRGGQPGKGGIHKLALLGVKTIINLRADDGRSSTEAEEAKQEGLQYFSVPFKRVGRPTDSQIEKTLSLIDAPANGVVFVHCHHGADRTGIVIAIYRITHDGWTDQEAKQEAESFGMKIWQRGMKDYISDYFRDKTKSSEKHEQSETGSLHKQPTWATLSGLVTYSAIILPKYHVRVK